MARKRSSFDETPVTTRRCDSPGCPAPGEHRAPRSPDDLGSHRWFCLDHVREYNRSWNYFTGWQPEQIEAYRHAANTWHRPTWRVGVGPDGRRRAAFGPDGLRDDFGIFEGSDPLGAATGHAAPAKMQAPVARAFTELNLGPKASAQEIKVRYKALVKQFHPDLNGGSKDAEERFKTINEAYSCLVAHGYA